MEQCRCSEYGTDALSSGHKGVYVNKDPSKSVMQLMDSLGGETALQFCFLTRNFKVQPSNSHILTRKS